MPAANGERTPLLSGTTAAYRGGGPPGVDGAGGGGGGGEHDDNESPLLPSSSLSSYTDEDKQPRKRRSSLPSLKKLDPYPGDGWEARTMNAAIRTREWLVQGLCCSAPQRWLDRYRERYGEQRPPVLVSIASRLSRLVSSERKEKNIIRKLSDDPRRFRTRDATPSPSPCLERRGEARRGGVDRARGRSKGLCWREALGYILF